MIENNNPEINVDELMQQIREEVQRRKASIQPDKSDQILLDKLPHYPTQSNFEAKERYHINDFLQFHDISFINNAYLGILKRHPDPEGFEFYLGELRQGQLKEGILARLRFSPEGRAKAVSITGITPSIIQYALSKIPVVGYLTELVLGIFKLPTLRRNLRQFQAYSMMLQTQHQEYQASLVQGITTNQQNLVIHINNAATKESFSILNDQFKLLDNNKVNKQELSELHNQLQEIEERKVNQAEIGKLRNQLQQERKVNQAEIDELRNQLQEIEEQKVNQEQIIELRKQLQEIEERKVNQAEIGELRNQLQQERKVNQAKIDELYNQLQEIEERKVNQAEIGELHKQLQGLEERKVNQAEIDELHNHLQGLEERKVNQEQISELHNHLQGLEERKVNQEEIKSLDTQIKETTKILHQVKREGIFLQRRLNMLLEEARKRLPKPFNHQQLEALAKESNHSLDAFYVAFEDEFRGTREDIKERTEIYLPIIQNAKAGTKKRPILDVGCGRGEWLELLKEHKYQAKGLDLNRVMIEQCQEYELDVIEYDVIEYLKQQKNNSLGAITGFHIVEHLPFETLVTLFDESLRVLKPGGVVIFETPNPENLIVGACNFYTDPTHKNPIPPHTLEFVIEARGFNKIKILRLHEIDSISFNNSFLHHQFTVGQDYSVIGYKA
jgi:SAM-dependent methyltransferase